MANASLSKKTRVTSGRWFADLNSENLRRTLRKILTNWQLYVFLLPTILYFLVFKYGPMYGIQIAFKDFVPTEGIWGSPWVGLEHFQRFFNSFQFGTLLRNTLVLSIYALVISFPLPVFLSLLMNQFPVVRYRRLVQTVIYAPTFISTVVLVGMINVFLSPRSGLINHLVVLFGGQPVQFMASPDWFPSIYVWSGVWQGTGFATIVYMAALASVDPALHEAAIMDGASKWGRIRYVDLPAIMPTIIILLILAVGNIMNVGFEKALLMQTPLNKPTSEIIQTYVYSLGLQRAQYSFSAAVGVFNSVVNLILLFMVNRFAKRVSDTSLW
ncbi:MAG: sugar ABC transporter permease [Chloroflexi bacterium]|uniref:ABC transporter permease n=1 Tax=Candidatus Flexifilum breve TaxID=3140694 RepID=UPI003134A57E|nr:sugar ABC transporter permease [Chloroflexota bacterium]